MESCLIRPLEVDSEIGAGCVGSNTTEISRCCLRCGDSEGTVANMCSSNCLIGPKEFLLVLIVLKEQYTSQMSELSGMA